MTTSQCILISLMNMGIGAVVAAVWIDHARAGPQAVGSVGLVVAVVAAMVLERMKNEAEEQS